MVTCVIVGLRTEVTLAQGIFEGEVFQACSSISPYLVSGEPEYVTSYNTPISAEMTPMVSGSMPRDEGKLILNTSEKDDLEKKYPNVQSLVKRFSGTSELTNGTIRWCLWIEDSDLDKALSIQPVKSRIEEVAKFRENSSAKTTNGYARIPHKFAQRSHKSGNSIIVSATSSQNREYLPADWNNEHVVVSNAAYVVYGGALFELGLLVSRLHLAWVATVCGRMKTDYRYSKTLGWNTFPVPTLTDQNKTDLTRCAEEILLAREHYFPATIAHMYDPTRMDSEFPLVRAAHERNDETIDRIYIGRRFKNDTERLEKLFELYTKMTAQQASQKESTKRKAKP